MGYLLDQMEKVAYFAEEAMMEKLADRTSKETKRIAADLANTEGKMKNKQRIAQLEEALGGAQKQLNTVRDAHKKLKWHNRALEQKATRAVDDLANFKNLGRFAGAAKWAKGNPRTALATAILGGTGLLGGAGAVGYNLNNGPKPAPKPAMLGTGMNAIA